MLKARISLARSSLRVHSFSRFESLLTRRWTSTTPDNFLGPEESQTSDSKQAAPLDTNTLENNSTSQQSFTENVSLETKDAVPASDPPPRSRGVKIAPKPQKIVILNARSSHILPKRRPVLAKPESSQKIVESQLDEQLKKLMVFKSEVSRSVLLESIDKLKPAILSVSTKRYKQLHSDITRGYTVPQLRDYVRDRFHFTPSRMVKQDIVSRILDTYWNIETSLDIGESSDVIVENIIPLSKRDLFLVLAGNGRLAREWTKSGARIVVVGSEQTIVIRSTEDTYKWIQISLTNALNSIKSIEFDFTPFDGVIDIEKLPLDKIQRLSDVYIERSGSKLTVFALGATSLRQAERLLWASSGYSPGITESFLIDTNSHNTKRGIYSQVIEEEQLSWLHRDQNWTRWRFPKTKPKKEEIQKSDPDLVDLFEELESSSEISTSETNPFDSIEPPQFQLLQKKPKTSTPVQIASSAESIREKFSDAITDSIFKAFSSSGSKSPKLDESVPSNVTIVATFGDILQPAPNSKSESPSITEKILNSKSHLETPFLSNVPNLVESCRQLPLFHQPMAEDAVEEDSADMEDLDSLGLDGLKAGENIDNEISLNSPRNHFSNKNESPAKIISDLFGSQETILDTTTAESKFSEAIPDGNTYYVQLKFLPSPFFPDGASSVVKQNKTAGYLIRPDGTTSDIVNKEQFTEFPPVELWLVVDELEYAHNDTATLVSVLKENNIYVPMPHLNTDIKYSASKSEFLLTPDTNGEEGDPSSVLTQIKNQRRDSIDKYLSYSQLNFSGKYKVSAPNIIVLDMPVVDPKTKKVTAVSIPYIYQNMSYRKQIDLKFNDYILQLAYIEGGVVGGRRIEANLVLDKPSEEMAGLENPKTIKSEDPTYDSVKTFVKNSLDFLEKIQTPPKASIK